MSLHSIQDRLERNRAEREAVLADVEREVATARDAIMSKAFNRLAQVEPNATLDYAVDQLGRVWRDAWPFDLPEGER
jgi:hypothetical protein